MLQAGLFTRKSPTSLMPDRERYRETALAFGLDLPVYSSHRRQGSCLASPAGCEVRLFWSDGSPDSRRPAVANFGLACCCSCASKSRGQPFLCIVSLFLRPLRRLSPAFYPRPHLRFLLRATPSATRYSLRLLRGRSGHRESLSRLPRDDSDSQLCQPCRLAPPAFVKAVAYGGYHGELRSLVHLLKYEGMQPIARRLGVLLADSLEPFAGSRNTDAGYPGAHASGQAAPAGLQPC